jgi:hypothetical protein
MRPQFFKSFLQWLPVAVCLAGIVSCRKTFDVKPQDAVDQEQMYRNVYDADAAVIGVYGKLMKLARPYILMNELRADLMDVTYNSDQYLKQLNEHNVTPDNPYIDPLPFYEVILNCNDVLKNFDIMLKENKMKVEEYRQRYSDVGAIRSWVYLQLGIHFGRVPYVTDPVAQAADLRDATKFPELPLGQLIDSLVSFTQKLPFKEDYPTGTTLQTTVDGYNLQKFFINKNNLLGDLFLWDGQYDSAAVYYKKIMEFSTSLGSGEQAYNQYRISSFSESGISYSRSLTTNSITMADESSLVYTPGWRYLFERGQDNQFNWEWIWVLPFDKNFQPQNPFIDLFSINGGSYLVKPSQQAISNWNSQKQTNSIPYDARGVFTWRNVNGQPVIMKYLYNYTDLLGVPSNIFSKQGKWLLSRAATVHLHYAEAANRAGKYKVAYALVNRGIKDTYDPTPGAGNTRDVSNIHQTFLPPPYDFDARLGDAPPYRSIWYRNQGIRGRANLNSVTLPATDSLTNVEDMILNESALELAYEGNRWSDLLRVALRRNDPSYLANKIYDKLVKAGNPQAGAVRAKLMNPENWFLPFKKQ